MDLDIVFYLSKITNFIGSEWLSAFMLILCYATMLFLWRIWQIKGLYLYNILAVIIANIQVLKMTSFSGMSNLSLLEQFCLPQLLRQAIF